MFGKIGIWELLLILAIVILIFGTKKLRNIGGDLGSALKNFRSSMKDGEQDAQRKQDADSLPGEASREQKKPDGQ